MSVAVCQSDCVYNVVSCLCPRPKEWLLAHELGDPSSLAWHLCHVISIHVARTTDIAYHLPLVFVFSIFNLIPYWLVGLIGWVIHTHGSKFKCERQACTESLPLTSVLWAPSLPHRRPPPGSAGAFPRCRETSEYTHIFRWWEGLAKASFQTASIWGALLCNGFKARTFLPS